MAKSINQPVCSKCLVPLDIKYDFDNRATLVTCPRCGIVFERDRKDGNNESN